MSMFDDIKNLSSKATPLRAPESYDRDIYQINKMLSMEDTLLPAIAEFSKYLFVLRGRYFYLLDSFMPKTSKRLYTKYTKRGLLTDDDRERIRNIQQATNYSGREAFVARMILEHEGVNIDKVFGKKEKRRGDAHAENA